MHVILQSFAMCFFSLRPLVIELNLVLWSTNRSYSNSVGLLCTRLVTLGSIILLVLGHDSACSVKELVVAHHQLLFTLFILMRF